jgi:hypothetical protein
MFLEGARTHVDSEEEEEIPEEDDDDDDAKKKRKKAEKKIRKGKEEEDRDHDDEAKDPFLSYSFSLGLLPFLSGVGLLPTKLDC